MNCYTVSKSGDNLPTAWRGERRSRRKRGRRWTEMGQAVSGMMGSSLTPSLLLLAFNERLKHVMAAAVFSSGPIQPLHVQKRLN